MFFVKPPITQISADFLPKQARKSLKSFKSVAKYMKVNILFKP